MSTLQEQNAINNGTCSSVLQPQTQANQQEDRISSLPDNLLITILSLLPIHSAASTSVLSRRWRHIWTHITNLSFHYLDKPTFKRFKFAVTTIDNIFSLLKSPKIHTFQLHLYFDRFQVSSGIIADWIHYICGRNPEVIKLSFRGYIYDYEIPNCVFETLSLVQLELYANFGFEFVPDASKMLCVNLPNLKKLALELSDMYTCISLIGTNGPLFKGCPLLEDLCLTLYFEKDDHVDNVVDISTPNLKCLRLNVMVDELEVGKLVIDAPDLEQYYFEGDMVFHDFVTIPSNLQEVEISIKKDFFRAYHDYESKISGLVQGISCVRSLVLKVSSINLLECISRLYEPPIFHNLIYLRFSYKSGDWIYKLPECFSLGKLKRVDIQDMKRDIIGINLIKHILSNAIVLEKLHVFVLHHGQSNLENDYKFCRELFMLSKSSVDCQIEFCGTALTASSKDFRDGVLACQIKDH